MLRLAWVRFSPDGPSGKRWYQQSVRGCLSGAFDPTGRLYTGGVSARRPARER